MYHFMALLIMEIVFFGFLCSGGIFMINKYIKGE